MSFVFRPLEATDVYVIAGWRYVSPYDIYNLNPPDQAGVQLFLDTYYGLTEEGEELVAFCCFGAEGQVPGGDYSPPALDIGMGVRPDLTGQGQGLVYVRAILDFARQTFQPALFRVTVAEFNQRALRVWEKASFRPGQTFRRDLDGLPFVLLLRDVY